jgi:hypothetical protein
MKEARNLGPSTATAGDDLSRSGRAWWRLPLLLAVVLVAIIAARMSQVQERSPASFDGAGDAAAPQPADATGKSVSLVIQFGDGRERIFDAVAWRPDMTVDDLMTAARELPGGITYRVGGERDMKMLVGIDEIVNEWGGGRNWTYQVNDVPADRSLAVYELQPGDRVLWTYGRRQ